MSFVRDSYSVVVPLVLLTVALVVQPATDAYGQSSNWAFPTKSVFVGELQDWYTAGGSTPHVGGCDGTQIPGWERYTCRGGDAGLWTMAKNFTDYQGREWRHKVAHIGYRIPGLGEFFPQKMELTSRIEPQQVLVDRIQSFGYPTFCENIDENLNSDALLVNDVNSLIGVTLHKEVRQFSNEYHDNYHIIEYTFTNTGNVDGELDPPEQTIEDFYFVRIRQNQPADVAAGILGQGSGWGATTLNDEIGLGLKDYSLQGQVYQDDLRAFYSWTGNVPSHPWNSLGLPLLRDDNFRVFDGDSVGRMVDHQFTGTVTLHADSRAHQPGETVPDDPDQPSHYNFISNGSPLTVTDPDNEDYMANEYAEVESGRIRQTHADVVAGSPNSDPETPEEWKQRMANQVNEPNIDIAGRIHLVAWGPYDLDPGESVTVAVARGVAGLREEAALEIGQQFKQHHRAGTPDAPIEFDANNNGTIEEDERQSKNMWVMSSRDSLFKMFERARRAYENDYQVPRAPLPPREFRVTSGTDEIRLEWDTYAEADPAGWELYRSRDNPEGLPRRGTVPGRDTGYELVAGMDELGPGATSYVDTEAQRGVEYFYYLQAVGPENTDGSAMVPEGIRLRSNRAYAQTYDPAFLRRPPGDELSDFQIVPNPHSINMDNQLRWSRRDQIQFLDIPGNCTIRIYTELGELVETIEHTDGSGDDEWNLTTSSNQVVVTGTYLVVVEDHDTGEEMMKKLVIIR
jgi:hypothetical protein